MIDQTPAQQSPILARLRWAVAILLLLISGSVAGYMLIEHWSFLDALYMTLTTLTTVGYGEIHPLSTAGRVFTMGVIVVGVGGMLYTLTAVVTYFVEVQFPGLIRRRRMSERIAQLRNHFIVCGYGRVGESLVDTLAMEKAGFVVIESDVAAYNRVVAAGHPALLADATKDETLKAAGIDRARGIVAAVDTDEANLYIVLSARVLRPDIFIVARATSEDAESKLKRVGANRVLTPYASAGRRMATLLLRPLVSDFLDTVMHSAKLELLLEEMTVSDDSPMAGKTIGEMNVRTKTGAIILAIQRRDGTLITSPDGDTPILAGDELVVLGTRQQLRQLEQQE